MQMHNSFLKGHSWRFLQRLTHCSTLVGPNIFFLIFVRFKLFYFQLKRREMPNVFRFLELVFTSCLFWLKCTWALVISIVWCLCVCFCLAVPMRITATRLYRLSWNLESTYVVQRRVSGFFISLCFKMAVVLWVFFTVIVKHVPCVPQTFTELEQFSLFILHFNVQKAINKDMTIMNLRRLKN